MRGLKNNKEAGNSKYISKDKTDMVYFDMIFYCANKYLNILKKNIVYPQVILSWEVGEWNIDNWGEGGDLGNVKITKETQ